MELDGRLKSLLARNSQEKNAQDLDKWLENKSRAGKNEERATNVKVSRVDNLAPQGYTLGGSAGGRNVDNNLQRVVSTSEERIETRPRDDQAWPTSQCQE